MDRTPTRGRWLAIALAASSTGCATAHRIDYSLDGLPRAPARSADVLAVAELKDLRRTVPENRAVFEQDKTFGAHGRVFCSNAESGYDPALPVARSVTTMIRGHLEARGAFRQVVLGAGSGDLVLTGALRQLYGVQERPTSVALASPVGFALFGALGAAVAAAATASASSPGMVRIELTDLALRRSDGTLVAELAPVSRSVDGPLGADAGCHRIYEHVDVALREVVDSLAKVVEASAQAR